MRVVGGGLGDARLGASRWFAGAVIHSLGARVALPRAEVPKVSSSEGYLSSCVIANAQNNAVNVGVQERKKPAHKQNDSGTSIKVMRKQLPQLVAKVVAHKASWPPPPLRPPQEAVAEHGSAAGSS